MNRIQERLTDSSGYVLMWAIFGFVVVISVVTFMVRGAQTERLTANAAIESDRSFYAAEAGLRRVLRSLTVGQVDSLETGDSLDLGWTDLEGQLKYHGSLKRVDDGEAASQPMFTLTVTGQAGGYYGGESTLTLALTHAPPQNGQALMFRGGLRIGSNPDVLGTCGNTYVIGDIELSGNLTTTGEVRATGRSIGRGDVQDTLGNPITVQTGVPEEEVPVVTQAELCAAPDFWLRNGWYVDMAVMDSADLAVGNHEGWDYTPLDNQYNLNDPPAGGTFCLDGNMRATGGLGNAGSAIGISVIAAGSISIGGNPFVLPTHPDGWIFVAGGDMKIGGKLEVGYENYQGFLYARSHCTFNGTPILRGRVWCYGDPNPPGAKEVADRHNLAGTLDIAYDCEGEVAPGTPLMPLAQRPWSQRF